MAELTKNLHFLKNGTEQTAKIYTTASEAGNNYITVKVDGTTGYVPIGDIGNINATMGMVNKSGNTYTILYSKLLSLTRTTATPLSVARKDLAATTVGDYALFGGGRSSSNSSTVDAYNTSLTRTTATPLSVARYYLVAASVGNYALFCGGSYQTTIDAYDASLIRTTATPLSAGRSYLAATTVGNYALFGGGYTRSGYSDTIDAYTVS